MAQPPTRRPPGESADDQSGLRSRVSWVIRRCVGNGRSRNADGQGAWPDLRDELAAGTDHVAIELVVVGAVDGDPDNFPGDLVDLVVLLGSAGDQAQSELDPVEKSSR